MATTLSNPEAFGLSRRAAQAPQHLVVLGDLVATPDGRATCDGILHGCEVCKTMRDLVDAPDLAREAALRASL